MPELFSQASADDFSSGAIVVKFRLQRDDDPYIGDFDPRMPSEIFLKQVKDILDSLWHG